MADIERRYLPVTATVPSGQARSQAIFYQPYALGGFVTPAALDATTVIGFEVSNDGENFSPLWNGAATDALIYKTVALNASHGYALPDELAGFAYFKIFCMTTGGAAVNQTAERIFSVNLKG